jgi:hypothetical protein
MGIRTPDLLIANETLYQLSYTPNMMIAKQLHDNPQSKNLYLSIPYKRREWTAPPSAAPAGFSAAFRMFRV